MGPWEVLADLPNCPLTSLSPPRAPCSRVAMRAVLWEHRGAPTSHGGEQEEGRAWAGPESCVSKGPRAS